LIPFELSTGSYPSPALGLNFRQGSSTRFLASDEAAIHPRYRE
jgi:hypothetical protein